MNNKNFLFLEGKPKLFLFINLKKINI